MARHSAGLDSNTLASQEFRALLDRYIVRAACVAERANAGDVPKVRDPGNIVVDGKPMTQQEFLMKFCRGKTFDETCVAVSRQMSMEAAKSKNGVPRF